MMTKTDEPVLKKAKKSQIAKRPKVPRRQKKVEDMYKDNPTWKEEDAQGPIAGYSKGGAAKKMYKTGGMVNSNPKLFADKIPGSKGVKSGVNPKVNKQTKPKGKVGGTSTAPKKAKPGKS
jgi:hypothetical protein